MFMISKIAFFMASLILLFISSPALPQKTDCLIEAVPEAVENRTYDEINGANGAKFFIERPNETALNKINAASFGLDEDREDNYEYFQKALDYCESNPNTKLVINKGTYHFKNKKSLVLENCRNILIEGNGASFVFSETGYKIVIYNSECIQINDLICDWNREEKPLESVVTVSNSSPDSDTLDIVFADKSKADENISLKTITQCDSDTYTFGAKETSKELYLYQLENPIQNVSKISDDTLRIKHNGCMDDFNNGETYIIRHFVYDGTVFQLTENSRDITFDGIKIYGSPGMAYICEGNSSHFQIINGYIGINEQEKDKYFVSCTADAIHIVNSNGCFNVENCDISAMGDDALNVHDGLGYVSSVNQNKLTVIASAMRLKIGDTLGFKNDKFENTDITAKIVDVKPVEGITWEITLDISATDKIYSGYVAFNKECDSSNYVIRNNYFHENRARGLLLQSSNGLCENNRFYKIMGQAIKVVADIEPTLWQEGTGVDNLIIRNNTFELCDYSKWGTLIEIGTNIDGKKAQSKVFTNIEISGNTFVGFPSYVLKAANINGLVFKENTIDCSNEFSKDTTQGRLHFYEECANITYKNNSWTDDGFLGIKKVAKADEISIWANVNSQIQICCKDNK